MHVLYQFLKLECFSCSPKRAVRRHSKFREWTLNVQISVLDCRSVFCVFRRGKKYKAWGKKEEWRVWGNFHMRKARLSPCATYNWDDTVTGKMGVTREWESAVTCWMERSVKLIESNAKTNPNCFAIQRSLDRNCWDLFSTPSAISSSELLSTREMCARKKVFNLV